MLSCITLLLVVMALSTFDITSDQKYQSTMNVLIIGGLLLPIGALWRLLKNKKDGKGGFLTVKRKGWTSDQKAQVRQRQSGMCNSCGHPPPRWEFHHKDGNRSNNSLSNCEGLCPNCHSIETYD